MDDGNRVGLRRSTVTLGTVEIELFEGGSGPPLLFLHSGSGLNPDAVFLQDLCKRFRVIAPVHPGFGELPLPMWIDCIDDYAHLYLELKTHLQLDRVVLVGASIGGWIAAEMATKTTHGIDAIVLIGPTGIKVGPSDRLDVPDIFAMSQQQVDRLLYTEPERHGFDASKLSEAELVAYVRNRQTLALVTWEPFMHNPKLKYRLHRIDRPTLILRGAADGFVSKDYAAAYAALIPGARLETIDGAGHSPQIEQPQRFVEQLVRFAHAQMQEAAR